MKRADEGVGPRDAPRYVAAIDRNPRRVPRTRSSDAGASDLGRSPKTHQPKLVSQIRGTRATAPFTRPGSGRVDRAARARGARVGALLGDRRAGVAVGRGVGEGARVLAGVGEGAVGAQGLVHRFSR